MHSPDDARARLHRGSSGQNSRRRFGQRTEVTRQRDTFSYLHSWIDTYRPDFERSPFAHDASLPMPKPVPCPDTALLAFAQLAALRLEARHSFVTLISTKTEFYLAEATRTMSFQQESALLDSRDMPWIGTCNFPRSDGLTTLALDDWRRARSLREAPTEQDLYYTEGVFPHFHIVSDMRCDKTIQATTFAQHATWGRFYFSVPLRSAHGSVIGAFAVMDDRPRYGVAADDMSFMEDIADTITEHLNSTIVRSQRQRSERLIQALGTFNRGKDSLREWWVGQQDSRLLNAGRHSKNAMSPMERQTLGNVEFGLVQDRNQQGEAVGGTSEPERHATKPHGEDLHRSTFSPLRQQSNVSDDEDGTIVKRITHRPSAPRRTRTKARSSRGDSFDLTTASEKTYARASNLMREALSADGVAFVDAHNISATLEHFRDSEKFKASAPSISEEATRLQGSTSGSESATSRSDGLNHCKVISFSARQEASSSGSKALLQQFQLPAAQLQRLIKRYPQGHIFNYGENGGLCSSSGGDEGVLYSGEEPKGRAKRKVSDAQRLLSTMAKARSIAFYPLWDETNERWRSGAFVWSTSPLRVFDESEDLTYLSSFGHSLVAELSRLEILAADKAKGTFISSISHELRSPLHGVLAAGEFLMESDLTMFQQEMALTISMAGRTLLDTVNHLLDHSKISNTSSAQKTERSDTDASRHQGLFEGNPNEIGVVSDVDLAQLTEELVETVVSTHRFQHSFGFELRNSTGVMGASRPVNLRQPSARKSEAGDVAITLNITWRKNWVVELQPGSWTRIVTNLVGNALKYTPRGSISVRLEVDEPTDDVETCPVHLIVEDTGIGMSKTFLANDLYTPFKQEDSHSTGTGLGLSIVKQIATDLGADLRITSQEVLGTRVVLSLHAKFRHGTLSDSVGGVAPEHSRTLGIEEFRLIKPPNLGGDQVDPQATSSSVVVNRSVMETCEEWLNCKVFEGSQMPNTVESTVHAISEEDLVAFAETDATLFTEMLSTVGAQNSHLLVLANSVRSLSEQYPLNQHLVKLVFVHQPIGPQKLLRAIYSGENPVTQPRPPDLASSDNLKNEAKKGESYPPQARATGQKDSSLAPNLAVRKLPGVKPSLSSPRPSALRPSEGSTKEDLSDKTFDSEVASPSSVSSDIDTPPHKTTNSGTRDTVLLVEDNDINMKLLVALMGKLKLPFQCASNGHEALDIYRNTASKFFLILMDLSMPVMDGYTAIAKIRNVEWTQHLPRATIIALTGVTSDESKQRAFGSGVDEYYTKPVHLKELRNLVDEARKRAL